MSEDLRVLLRREAAIRTVVDTFVATDERDWNRLRELFDETVRFDMSSLTGDAAAEVPAGDIIGAWKEGLEPLASVHHQVGNFQVDLHPGGADVRCYGVAYHHLPNETGENTRRFVGTYEFHVHKRNGPWQVDALTFHLKFVDGNLELEKAPVTT
jgi:hypothetical protein